MAQWQFPSRGIDARGDTRDEWGLSGGIFTGLSSFEIKDTQSANEYGWDTDESYPAKATARSPLAYGSAPGTATRLLSGFSNKHLVRAVGTKLQYDKDGVWTDILGSFTDADWSAANFDVNGAALILTNGTDTVKYWNGTALQDLSTAPKGKIIAADNLRVFIAAVTGESGDEIHYCAFQDATDWSAVENSGIVQYYTSGGGPVTAMIAFGGQIWVFKKDAFALIYHTGDSRAFYRLVPSSESIGCIASRTLVDLGSMLCWLGADDVYIGAAGSASRIGEPVRTFLNRINPAAVGKACAFTDGIRYYLCLPIDGATTPNVRLVYDQRYKIWSVAAMNEGYLAGVYFGGKVYAGNGSGQTYQLNAAPAAGPWMVETKDFDRSEAEKEYNELHLQLAATGPVSIQVSTDQGASWITLPDSFVGSGVVANQNVIIPLDLVPLAFWIRFRLSGLGPCRLYGLERYFKVHPVQY